MRNTLCSLLFVAAAFSLQAQNQPISVSVTGNPADHTVRWNTNPTRCYQLQVSTNLQSWSSVDDNVSGNGDMMECRCTSPNPPPRLYYRVAELNPGFLARPLAGAKIYREDGVCFAFNLDSAPSNVAKICISKRPNSSSPWEQIGLITDIVTFKGVKTVRGPAIWLPQSSGSYEVKVEGKTASGSVLCSETRQILVVDNSPPSIAITGYSEVPPFTNPNASNGRITFTTQVSDPDDDDQVARVEYYANGELIGTDSTPPFGNFTIDDDIAYGLVNIRGEHSFSPNSLGPSVHIISAKAYDTRGGVGETPNNTPFVANYTGAATNKRPLVDSLDHANNYLIKALSDTTPVTANYSLIDPNSTASYNDVNVINVSSDLQIPGGQNINIYPNFVGGQTSVSGTLSLNTQTWQPGLHTLTFHVIDNGNGNFNNKFISYRKTFQILVPSSQFASAAAMAAQLTHSSAPVDTTYSPVRFWGPYAAGQPYTGGNAAGLDASTPAGQRTMDTGVILSTGRVWSSNSGAGVPAWNINDQDDYNSKEWFTPGDSQLHDRLARYSGASGVAYTRDACSLEFDVNCVNSQLEMELQFGSEDFPELIGDPTGRAWDAFGVTIDGTLVSIVPDGGAAISSKAIHPQVSGAITLWPGDQNITHPALREHLYLSDDTEINAAANSTNQVEYDGMTVRLRIHVFVTPGLHKIRLSVTDAEYPSIVPVTRASGDSAVFIRSGSIRTIVPTP